MISPNAEEQHRLFAMSLFERVLSSFGYRRICGIDEAGRGPLAGPVVAAAVIFPSGFAIPGLRDSKLLTPLQRETLFSQIFEKALSVGIGIIDSDLIDKVNILQATILAMQRSLDQLLVKPDYLLIDALTLPGLSIGQKGIIHGDNLSVSIAAASVIAKVTRDRLMRQYHGEFPEYRFDTHKGYGTHQHLEKIRQFGPCRLHRRTFRGVIQ